MLFPDTVSIVAIVLATGILITSLLTGSRIKFGKFEIGKNSDHLDKQIDDIATIVNTKNEMSKNSLVQSVMDITKNVVLSIGTPSITIDYEGLLESAVKKFTTKKEDPTWPLVEGLINNYHKQALSQASIQFWFSLIAAVVGFSFVIKGIAFSPELSATDKAISTIPGIVLDLVAALFFKQAEQTRQRATDLYDRLRKDNERTVSIDLIDSIDNENLRSIVKAQLALKIGGVDSSIPDLSTLTQHVNKSSAV